MTRNMKSFGELASLNYSSKPVDKQEEIKTEGIEYPDVISSEEEKAEPKVTVLMPNIDRASLAEMVSKANASISMLTVDEENELNKQIMSDEELLLDNEVPFVASANEEDLEIDDTKVEEFVKIMTEELDEELAIDPQAQSESQPWDYTTFADDQAGDAFVQDESDEPEVSYDEPESELTTAEIELNADIERIQLISEINDFTELLDIPPLKRNLELMDTQALKDYLYLLRTNNGGSLQVATLINEVEIEYDKFLKSDTMKMRMKLIEGKSTDVVKMMQQMRQFVGNDFAMSNTRSTDYHLMLKTAVSNISVMHDKIMQIGQTLGIKMPVDSFKVRGETVPVIEGMPADPRISMYVLNVFMSHLDKITTQLDVSNKQHSRNVDRIKHLEDREKFLNKSLTEKIEYAGSIFKEYEKYVNTSCEWIITDINGKMLRVIDTEMPLKSADDLDLRGTLETCKKFPNKAMARAWAERIGATKRFRRRELVVKRISIVSDN